MARPIKETPILFGEDARRFESRMKNPPKENAARREVRLRNYHLMMEALMAGERDRQSGHTPSCIVSIAGHGE